MDQSNPVASEMADQTLFTWSAPLRPFKKRSTTLLRFFLAVALLISAVVFFFGDLVTVVPIWALLFLFYIFAITPPPIIENRITVFGVETAGVMLRWDALSHYYFDERLGYRLVVLVTHGPYYAHSYLVMPDEDTRIKVSKILNQHLMCLTNPPKTFTDKIIRFLYGLIPEERPSFSEGPRNTV
ncbi:MAG TPA: hypothetical protein PKG71_02095 [Candidatus Woesebacteria bacterium]|nr:hypothetical protein [Candidatus Woesebacteria bacterium]HNS94736.1 hypothetical protein [Candidatus Woesebacteria bacterium]